jgi:broad specificity phosphatase PhoE
MTDYREFYIVRHGETDYNKNGYIQGSGINASLNKRGRQQASAFYDYYKNTAFERIYISELIRTRESVHSFIELGLPIEERAELNEISWGGFEGKKIDKNLKAYYDKIIEKWNIGKTTYAIDGGESPDDVAFRQKDFINELMKVETKKTLICMHGRAMRILLCGLLQIPLENMNKFNHHNMGLYTLKLNGKNKKLELQNCTAHLTVNGIESLSQITSK